MHPFLKKKKEVDDETKLILGDVAELSPEYRVLNGLTRPLRDIVILDFFNEVSQNQNWALRDGDMLIDLKMEINKEKEESDKKSHELSNNILILESEKLELEITKEGLEREKGSVGESFGNLKTENDEVKYRETCLI